jgi:AraC-like DNA-binding protein
VDEVRCELATRYLADRGRTLADIAALLGFAAPSGFSRWYKQQFGTTAAANRAHPVRTAEPTRKRRTVRDD